MCPRPQQVSASENRGHLGPMKTSPLTGTRQHFRCKNKFSGSNQPSQISEQWQLIWLDHVTEIWQWNEKRVKNLEWMQKRRKSLSFLKNSVSRILDLLGNLHSLSTLHPTPPCLSFSWEFISRPYQSYDKASTSLKHLLGGQGEIQSRIESCNSHR